MSRVGTVDSLWRYPVKSMRGEELDAAFLGLGGVRGDRIFAFQSSESPKNFPYFTARQQREMLRFRPRFRPDEPTGFLVDVETPEGERFAVDDPALIRRLCDGLSSNPTLTLLRSECALGDCHPVSLFSLQTAHQLGDELGMPVDPRRFRANVYLDLADLGGFGEDTLVGRTLRLGPEVVVSILERDRRCKMISLDPDTGRTNPEILRQVALDHEGMAGVYAAVLVEGIVTKGDTVELQD